jgi:hypothetical protein
LGLRNSRLRGFLVVGQVAVSVVLLIGTATLVRNATAAARTDLGFEPQGLISVNQRAQGNELITKAERNLRPDADIDQSSIDVTIVGVASEVVSSFIYAGKDAAHLYMQPALARSSSRELVEITGDRELCVASRHNGCGSLCACTA